MKEHSRPMPAEVESFDIDRFRDKIRTVALGDSITENGNIPYEGRWTSLLQGRFENMAVINAGIGGTSSAYALYRYDRDVAPVKPHIVVINFVLNDGHVCYYECPTSYVNKLTPVHSRESLTSLIERIRSDGAEPVFWTPLPFGPWMDHYVGPGHYEIQRKCYDWYLEIAREVALWNDVPLADLWERFSTVEGYPGDYLARPDNLHPTATAQPIMADEIAKAIRPLLENVEVKNG